MASRNRIIYASQSVRVNGEILYRVQNLGSSATFTSEDVFELGQLDIIDVVDDVPAVEVTLDTNDWGDVRTMMTLAGLCTDYLAEAPSISGSNLKAVTSGTRYYHGVALSDFGISFACTGRRGFSLWAPVQSECSQGTTDDIIDQTLFMDRCFVNSIEMSYNVGANATENYGAETEYKIWLLNDGRFISQEEWDLTAAVIAQIQSNSNAIQLGLTAGSESVPTLSDGSLGFLWKDSDGMPCVRFWDASADSGAGAWYEIAVEAGTGQASDTFVYDSSTNVLYFPSSGRAADGGENGDQLSVLYCADAYAHSIGTGVEAVSRKANYFTKAEDAVASSVPEDVGALRQGQVEVYLINPGVTTGWDTAWRLQTVTIRSTLTREPIFELGHLRAFDRPVRFPVEIATTVESLAGDLETFAKFCGKESEYAAGTLDDVDIYDLLSKDDMVLVVKIYQQTDEEAGGTGANRKALLPDLDGKEWYSAGTKGTYTVPNSPPDTEYPLKTVIIPGLKVTDEAYTLNMGANATQTFGFRSTNKMFVVRGDVHFDDITVIAKNTDYECPKPVA